MLKILTVVLLLCSCRHVDIPQEFVYKNIKVGDFNIATWQKTTQPNGVYKIYIEGDGYAFNKYGVPTQNPTPKGYLVRELAFRDSSPNVIYLSRPCQYVKSLTCSQRYWTTARFAPEIIDAEYEAIKSIVGKKPIILIGFSGGAQIAGLIASAKNGLNIKKIITIAGNLDHLAWTQYHSLPPLNESMNLRDYKAKFKQIPQVHYVGSKDNIIPQCLVKNFIGESDSLINVDGATHNKGWESIYPTIWNTL